MPLYCFDVSDNDKNFPDTVGTTLATIDAARTEALRTLGEMARDALPDGDHRVLRIKIRENHGPILLSAALTLNVEWGST